MDQEFTTRSVSIAAFLLVEGFRLQQTSKDDDRLIFHFPAAARAAAREYDRDKLVPVSRYVRKFLDLMSLTRVL